jgi:hypothetical protein
MKQNTATGKLDTNGKCQLVLDCSVLFFAYQGKNLHVHPHVPQTLHVKIAHVRSPYHVIIEVSMTIGHMVV